MANRIWLTQCCVCRKIKRADGEWELWDVDPEDNPSYSVSHTYCPVCKEETRKHWVEVLKKQGLSLVVPVHQAACCCAKEA